MRIDFSVPIGRLSIDGYITGRPQLDVEAQTITVVDPQVSVASVDVPQAVVDAVSRLVLQPIPIQNLPYDISVTGLTVQPDGLLLLGHRPEHPAAGPLSRRSRPLRGRLRSGSNPSEVRAGARWSGGLSVDGQSAAVRRSLCEAGSASPGSCRPPTRSRGVPRRRPSPRGRERLGGGRRRRAASGVRGRSRPPGGCRHRR